MTGSNSSPHPHPPAPHQPAPENIIPLTTGDRLPDEEYDTTGEKESLLPPVKKKDDSEEDVEPTADSITNIDTKEEEAEQEERESTNDTPTDGGPTKVQFAMFMIVMWATGFLINLIRIYPAVFSTEIQDRTGASTTAISTLFLFPQILSIFLGLITPSLLGMFGLFGCNLGSSIGIVGSFALVGVGISIERFVPVIIGTSIALPLFSIQTFAMRMTTLAGLPKDDYTEWSAIGSSIMALGYAAAHLVLPHLDVEVGTWVVVALTVAVAILSQTFIVQGFAMSKIRTDEGGALPPDLPIADFGKQSDDDDEEEEEEKEGGREQEDNSNKETPEQPVATTKQQQHPTAMARLVKDLKEKLSIEALKSFPMPYWNVALLGAFTSAFHAYADVFPNIYQRVHGLTSVQANQMASFNSTTISCIVAGPLAGWAFARTGTKQLGIITIPSRGIIFVGSSFLFVLAHLIPALFWAIWIGYYTIILQGSGSSFLAVGANGIIPQILKDQSHTIAAAYTWSAVIGRFFAVAAAQLCYHTFEHSFEINEDGILTITPGEFYMTAMGVITTILAIGYKKIDDRLTREAAEQTAEQESVDSEQTAECGKDTENDVGEEQSA